MIQFRVVGTPTPQGSHRAVMMGGRPHLIPAGSSEAKARHKAWRSAVHDAAKAYIDTDPIWTGPIDEPVGIVVAFTFPTVPSDKYRVRHVTAPDLDKLVRSVFDSLTTGGLLADDSRVCAVSATKVHNDTDPPGALVTVYRYGKEEADDRDARKRAARHRT